MKTELSSNSGKDKSLDLPPYPRLPLLIILLGVPLWFVPFSNQWSSIIITSFGIFLLIQTLTLRIEFTDKALVVKQLGREIRNFPFKNWVAWRLLLPKLPGLLYFRETASPHLLPIIFDPVQLEKELKNKVGHLETPKTTEKNPID